MQPEDANRQRLTFSKKERICSKLQIESLLQKKRKVFCYPFKCYYDFTPATDERTVNQVLVCVPKRMLKHAVDRNRVKRLTREAYRLNHRQHLDTHTRAHNVCADLFLYYTAKEILPYRTVEGKIIEIMQRLSKQLT